MVKRKYGEKHSYYTPLGGKLRDEPYRRRNQCYNYHRLGIISMVPMCTIEYIYISEAHGALVI